MSLRFAGAGGSDNIRFEFTYTFSKRFLEFAKVSGTVINETVIHDLIVSALSPAWKEARASAPVDTGFLRDHIFVYMISNTEGWLVAEADYSAAQDKGYRNRKGKFITGTHFMSGPFATAKKTLESNMKFLEKAFISGVKAQFKGLGITIKTGYPQAVKKPTRTGFQRQATVRKRARYTDTGVFHVQRKRVQLRSIFRKQPRQLIGGNQ